MVNVLPFDTFTVPAFEKLPDVVRFRLPASVRPPLAVLVVRPANASWPDESRTWDEVPVSVILPVFEVMSPGIWSVPVT